MGYFRNGTYVGRIWSKKNNGPSVVKIIDNEIYDITTKEIPTVSSLLELQNPIDYVKQSHGNKVTSIKDFVIKGSIKGKIGTFSIKEGQLTQKLNMYKVSDKKFIKF